MDEKLGSFFVLKNLCVLCVKKDSVFSVFSVFQKTPCISRGRQDCRPSTKTLCLRERFFRRRAFADKKRQARERLSFFSKARVTRIRFPARRKCAWSKNPVRTWSKRRLSLPRPAGAPRHAGDAHGPDRARARIGPPSGTRSGRGKARCPDIARRDVLLPNPQRERRFCKR